MTLVPIPGLDATTLDKTSTTPAQVGLHPFPCTTSGWTQHTAMVTSAELKCFESGSEALSLKVANGEYGGELLVNLPPYEPDYQEKSFETLVKTIKILGCHTDGKLDLDKLKKASGQIVSLIANHKGFRQGNNGRSYHKVSLILTGDAPALQPVKQVQMPPLPGAAPMAATGTDDDIPF
jgi:hypothetical protein